MGYLSGCTLNLRAPKLAFHAVNVAESKGYEVSSAFNATALRWPLLTWSISGTYLPGSHAVGREEGEASVHAFPWYGNSPFNLVIDSLPSCAPSERARDQLTKALADTLSKAEGLPVEGAVRIRMSASQAPVRRYVLSARTGRRFHLAYWTPCLPGRGDESLWFAAMVALHEATHAALDVRGLRPQEVKAEERLAMGGELCLWEALARMEPDVAKSYPIIADRFHDVYQLQGEKLDATRLCEAWVAYIRAANEK